MFRKLLCLFLAVILTACASKPAPVPTPSGVQMDSVEEAVYAALLRSLYSASAYVIMDSTATDPGGVENLASSMELIARDMPGLDPETAGSFRVRNDKVYPVRSNLNLGSGYVLLSRDEMSQIFAQNRDGWQFFYEQYPDAPGITTLSRVGFNDPLDQALVYVGTMSHWLAGAGYFVLLSKVDGAWIVEQKVLTWIS